MSLLKLRSPVAPNTTRSKTATGMIWAVIGSSARKLSTAARVGKAGIAPRSQGGQRADRIGEAAQPVEPRRVGDGVRLGQDTSDQPGHEAVTGAGGVDRLAP